MTTAFQSDAFQSNAFQIHGGQQSGGVSGSLSYTNNNDALNGAGTSKIVGSLARTNNNDTLVANSNSGTPVNVGAGRRRHKWLVEWKNKDYYFWSADDARAFLKQVERKVEVKPKAQKKPPVVKYQDVEIYGPDTPEPIKLKFTNKDYSSVILYAKAVEQYLPKVEQYLPKDDYEDLIDLLRLIDD